MALLFQSNPDQWDLRRSLRPGDFVSWLVSRYEPMMRRGTVVLLWEAKGSAPPKVRGLYGWGITTGGPQSEGGRTRVHVQYIERWVTKQDEEQGVPDEDHVAAISADDVLALPAWRDHLLARLPIGTNFLVSADQMAELTKLVETRLDGSQLPRAAAMEAKGQPLDPAVFRHQRLVTRGLADG